MHLQNAGSHLLIMADLMAAHRCGRAAVRRRGLAAIRRRGRTVVRGGGIMANPRRHNRGQHNTAPGNNIYFMLIKFLHNNSLKQKTRKPVWPGKVYH